MNVTVIVWLGVGLVIFILSFLLPKRREELDEDTKKFAGEQIRDILNKEIAGMQSKLDGVVSETIEESSSLTERALEKLTNEKIMAINEYSDTVIEDINNNHKEVLFLYDMLNDKHVTIRNTVTEVEKAMGEVTQTAKDVEISAKEAAKGAKDSEETVKRVTDITNRAEKAAQITAQNIETDVRHIVEDMIRGRVEETMEKTALPMIQERVDEILEDATLFMEQQPKILVDTKASESGDKAAESMQGAFPSALEEQQKEKEEASGGFVQGIVKDAPKVIIEGEEEGSLSYYIVEPEKAETTIPTETVKAAEMGNTLMDTVAKIAGTEMAPEEIRKLERAVAMEVMQGAQKKQQNPPKEETDGEKHGTSKEAAAKEDIVKEDILKEDVLKEDVTKENVTKEDVSEQEEFSAGSQKDDRKKKPHRAAKKQRKEQERSTRENYLAEQDKENGTTQENSTAVEQKGQEKRNNNDKILALHKEGMSNMAIAKELGLGVGEVKLVIDLFKGM